MSSRVLPGRAEPRTRTFREAESEGTRRPWSRRGGKGRDGTSRALPTSSLSLLFVFQESRALMPYQYKQLYRVSVSRKRCLRKNAPGRVRVFHDGVTLIADTGAQLLPCAQLKRLAAHN